MSEDSYRLSSDETRQALGDLTNRLKKRGISSISSGCDSFQRSEDDSRGKFSKRLCVVVDDLVKENASPVARMKGSSCDFKISSVDSDEKASVESHDDDVSGDSKLLKEFYFEPGDRDGARELNKAAAIANQTDVSSGEDEGEGLALSVLKRNTESETPLVAANIQDLRSFEMRKCSNVVNKEEDMNQSMGDDDLLKSCSCSFCLKAAYIWSDLHYQDIKGRLSALKKSQKEASNLIQRNSEESSKDLVNSVGSTKLESNLKGQWRSLFVSMGDILAHESNHLQNSFLRMKELREDCKIDLERATKPA